MTNAATGGKVAQHRKTAAQALAALQVKQNALALKISKVQKDIEERKNSAIVAQRARVGKLAAEAGILELNDEVLKKAFAEIASKNGIERADTEPAVTT